MLIVPTNEIFFRYFSLSLTQPQLTFFRAHLRNLTSFIRDNVAFRKKPRWWWVTETRKRWNARFSTWWTRSYDFKVRGTGLSNRVEFAIRRFRTVIGRVDTRTHDEDAESRIMSSWNPVSRIWDPRRTCLHSSRWGAVARRGLIIWA